MRLTRTLAIAAAALTLSLGTASAKEGTAPGVAPDAAMKMLMEGNGRFIAAKVARPNQTPARRTEVAKGQHPFAIILSCADSRVPPELLFDTGLGDLFVIRVAGNMVTDEVLGSIEYAVEHLGSALIMVLGHERCGAVDATLKGGEAPGHIGSLVKAIQPAVASAKGKPGDALDNAVKANVSMVVGQLKANQPILAEWIKKNKLKVVGARYDLDSGAVDLVI